MGWLDLFLASIKNDSKVDRYELKKVIQRKEQQEQCFWTGGDEVQICIVELTSLSQRRLDPEIGS